MNRQEQLSPNQNLKSKNSFYRKVKTVLFFVGLIVILLIVMLESIARESYYRDKCSKLDVLQCKKNKNCRVGEASISVPTEDGGHWDAFDYKCFSIEYCNEHPGLECNDTYYNAYIDYCNKHPSSKRCDDTCNTRK